jgi:hypothetical protein
MIHRQLRNELGRRNLIVVLMMLTIALTVLAGVQGWRADYHERRADMLERRLSDSIEIMNEAVLQTTDCVTILKNFEDEE